MYVIFLYFCLCSAKEMKCYFLIILYLMFLHDFKDHISSVQFSSVTQSCPTLWPHEPQHARPPCPSPTPGVHPNPCPSSQWCHPTISSSVVPFSSCPQSFPASDYIFHFKREFDIINIISIINQNWFFALQTSYSFYFEYCIDEYL